jgi:membrane-bound lytic murein transglycosylase D
MARDPEFQQEVARWVARWRTNGMLGFGQDLERMAWFAPMVDSALARSELPASLRYLPIVESGYSPRAVSRASAVGLWQFMEPTARALGMRVGPLFDERRNPLKSTEAAGVFLRQLRDDFGSWFLALAAYNAGPGRLRRLLAEHAPLTPGSDSLYWALRRRLPPETRDFVPKFFAAAALAGNPVEHGFDRPDDESRFVFDEVVVPDATTLDVIAKAAEVPEADIIRLNPEVVRGFTPPGEEVTLRVPLGQGQLFRDNYARIPAEERVSFVEHRIVSGETLSHVAVRYGVPLRDLTDANPGVDSRRLRVGQRLTVPVAPSARAGVRPSASSG